MIVPLRKLTDNEKNLLKSIVAVGEWYLDADKLVEAAHLVECGFVSAKSTRDGIYVLPTQGGRDEAEHLMIEESRPAKLSVVR